MEKQFYFRGYHDESAENFIPLHHEKEQYIVGSISVELQKEIDKISSRLQAGKIIYTFNEDLNISKDFIMQVYEDITKKGLGEPYVFIMIDAIQLYKNGSIPLIAEEIENAINAYCETFKSPYNRLLELGNNPSLFDADNARARFTNTYNALKKRENSESEFELEEASRLTEDQLIGDVEANERPMVVDGDFMSKEGVKVSLNEQIEGNYLDEQTVIDEELQQEDSPLLIDVDEEIDVDTVEEETTQTEILQEALNNLEDLDTDVSDDNDILNEALDSSESSEVLLEDEEIDSLQDEFNLDSSSEESNLLVENEINIEEELSLDEEVDGLSLTEEVEEEVAVSLEDESTTSVYEQVEVSNEEVEYLLGESKDTSREEEEEEESEIEVEQEQSKEEDSSLADLVEEVDLDDYKEQGEEQLEDESLMEDDLVEISVPTREVRPNEVYNVNEEYVEIVNDGVSISSIKDKLEENKPKQEINSTNIQTEESDEKQMLKAWLEGSDNMNNTNSESDNDEPLNPQEDIVPLEETDEEPSTSEWSKGQNSTYDSQDEGSSDKSSEGDTLLENEKDNSEVSEPALGLTPFGTEQRWIKSKEKELSLKEVDIDKVVEKALEKAYKSFDEKLQQVTQSYESKISELMKKLEEKEKEPSQKEQSQVINSISAYYEPNTLTESSMKEPLMDETQNKKLIEKETEKGNEKVFGMKDVLAPKPTVILNKTEKVNTYLEPEIGYVYKPNGEQNNLSVKEKNKLEKYDAERRRIVENIIRSKGAETYE